MGQALKAVYRQADRRCTVNDRSALAPVLHSPPGAAPKRASKLQLSFDPQARCALQRH